MVIFKTINKTLIREPKSSESFDYRFIDYNIFKLKAFKLILFFFEILLQLLSRTIDIF